MSDNLPPEPPVQTGLAPIPNAFCPMCYAPAMNGNKFTYCPDCGEIILPISAAEVENIRLANIGASEFEREYRKVAG